MYIVRCVCVCVRLTSQIQLWKVLDLSVQPHSVHTVTSHTQEVPEVYTACT